MMDPALWSPFFDWLNKRTSDDDMRPWDELGLRSDAPPEAVEAYEKFCAIAADAKRKRIRL